MFPIIYEHFIHLHYYLVVLHGLEWVALYFFAVETKGRSLEELEEIFTDPKPVRRSLQKRAVLLTEGAGVKTITD